MAKVYSIVVTYNGEKWIGKCLDSLRNSSVSSKILVIDNNSSDKTVSVIKSHYPEVDVTVLNKNVGFGRANNLGLQKALQDDADFVFLLNQDAWVESDTVAELVACALVSPKAGVLAPLNFTPEGKLEPVFLKELTETNYPGLISDLINGNPQRIYPTTFYINASCWLLTKMCLAHVGGFDPLFDHYGEDVDYCKRAIYHDFEVSLCTKAKEYHARSVSKKNKMTFRKRLLTTKTRYLNNNLLFKLKDLQANFVAQYFFASLDTLFLVIKYSLKLSFKNALIYLLIFFKLQIKTPSLFLSRIQCKRRQASFLSVPVSG